MSFQRRQLLQILSYAFGSSFILPRNVAMAAQNPARSPAPPIPHPQSSASARSSLIYKPANSATPGRK